MGISGLLPLLKDIQVNRHLSEFAGETIAVDAYVWLHRGTYGCAPELVTGKRTTKYVDYAMHRVRLLRHHGIQPYIVFDGGPLPAKKGTESSRKQKRDENLSRANALAAQGKHNQAREYYVKCIDVTPQMAYQLIKVLRAESVPYVVAPYEADAQMAYMERIGLVDGILTEDSDLLVFGCRRVLFKLDTTASRVTCIARTDFASLTDTSAGGISLLGWSDVQFRAMAILSGCDYLPSIPGIGLKTAWALLRRYKTAENVVRALSLEGKKKVPKGYMEAFRLTEKVFLHQRVYNPTQERLVHLNDLPHDEEWDDEKEAFVGANIEPSLAKQVAEGDACPISLLPMEDINPSYVPRALKAIPMNVKNIGQSDKDRAKERRKESEKPPLGGLLHFFTPKSKAAATPKSCSRMNGAQAEKSSAKVVITAGRSSGKRTLAEVMEQDMAVKRKKQEEYSNPASRPISSKFFCRATPSPQSKCKNSSHKELFPEAGPSRLVYDVEDKENEPVLDDDDILMDDSDPVQQEEGYISPSPSLTRLDTPELSSPLQPTGASRPCGDNEDDNFGADVLSSPPVVKSRARRFSCDTGDGKGRTDAVGAGLVRNTPSLREDGQEALGRPVDSGPDLRDTFGEWDWDDVTSEIECSDASLRSVRSGASSPGPVTPDDSAELVREKAALCGEDMVDVDDLEDVIDSQEIAARNETVALGWWEKWARSGKRAPGGERKFAPLRRSETTMTPDGRQRPLQVRPHSAHPGSKRKGVQQQDLRSAGRRSLVFMEEAKTTPKTSLLHDATYARPGSAGSKKAESITATARNRLAEFKWMAAG